VYSRANQFSQSISLTFHRFFCGLPPSGNFIPDSFFEGWEEYFSRHRYLNLTDVLGKQKTPQNYIWKDSVFNVGTKIQIHGAKIQVNGDKILVHSAKTQICGASNSNTWIFVHTNLLCRRQGKLPPPPVWHPPIPPSVWVNAHPVFLSFLCGYRN